MSSKPSRDVFVVSDEEAELRKKGYILGVTLGEGSYAKVKSAYNEVDQKRVAIKIINRRRAPKDFREKFLPRELQVMRGLSHPNVIHLFEIMEFQGKVYIVMEHAGHGDLLEYIKLRGAIPEVKAQDMFNQVINAVEYLHNNNIVHRDLKCENLLLDSMNNIKVSDFGFARFFNKGDMSKTFCGSAAYAAPEVLQGIAYPVTLHDIWSMGIILYIMICASMPYDDSNLKKMIKEQREKKVGFPKSKRVSEEAKDLVHKILEAQTGKRATLKSIKEHSWLSRFQQNKMETEETPSESTPKTSSDSAIVVAPQNTPCEVNKEKGTAIDGSDQVNSGAPAVGTQIGTQIGTMAGPGTGAECRTGVKEYNGVIITDFVDDLNRLNVD